MIFLLDRSDSFPFVFYRHVFNVSKVNATSKVLKIEHAHEFELRKHEMTLLGKVRITSHQNVKILYKNDTCDLKRLAWT